MTTYNLITVRHDQAAGIEPIVADTEEKAIAYAAGMLSERVKGHEDMFRSPSVRWGLDTGETDLAKVTALIGPFLGTFDLVQRGGVPKLVWSPGL